MQLVSIFRMLVLSVAIIYTFQLSSFASVFAHFTCARVVGLFYRRLFYFRQRNQKRKFLISVHFRISRSRTPTHAHICMYIITLLEIATYADHMHNKLWWTGFPTKWKTNKSIVLQGGEGENIRSITNMRVIATIKGYNASKKKNKNKKRQKEIASKMF